MKQLRRKLVLFLTAVAMCLVVIGGVATPASAATKPKKLKLNKTSVSIEVGAKTTLKVKSATPSKASKSVKWTTSNKKVATVTSKGVVKGVKAGKATITATSKLNKKVKAKCTVYVRKWSTVKASKGTYSIATKKVDKIRVTAGGKKFDVKVSTLKADVKELYNAFYSKKNASISYKSSDKKATVSIKVDKSKKTVKFTNSLGKKNGAGTYKYTAKKNSKKKSSTVTLTKGKLKYTLVVTSTTAKLYLGTKTTSSKLLASVEVSSSKVKLFDKGAPLPKVTKVQAHTY